LTLRVIQSFLEPRELFLLSKCGRKNLRIVVLFSVVISRSKSFILTENGFDQNLFLAPGRELLTTQHIFVVGAIEKLRLSL